MRSKSTRLVRRNHARYHRGRDDLNIVPMIDMMVILVFFLIFTAVFSKTNILPLNLPSNAAPGAPLPKGLALEVIIRPGDILVNDRNSGPLEDFANQGGAYDYDGLSLFMRRVKAQFPAMTAATVLLGPNVPYDVLVHVMDTVRVYQLPTPPFPKARLFPDISIGDAPT
ncbi:MAG TPA: biopolymer transporter ExbD [Steroidobacteraceae bacterium]|nr:biopolymer transporter ExbD [Steroidobacteraceae bacterium]